jgi:hypothetical protein
MTSVFLTKDNVDLLWEIIMEEDFTKQHIPNEQMNHFRNYFIVQIKEFHNVTAKLNIPLVQINKQFISNFMMVLASQQSTTTPKRVNMGNANANANANANPNSQIAQNKQLYTSQEIQAERKTQFENDLTRKQGEFTRAMTVPVPEIPNFSEELDKPIGSAMDDLIAKTLAERNYDIQLIQKQNPPPPSIETKPKERQNEQQFKYIKIGEEVKGTVMTPIDVNEVFSEISGISGKHGMKNVSWGENEYQEYKQSSNLEEPGFTNLFSKLKQKSTLTQQEEDIRELKKSIIEIQKQMNGFDEKIEIILHKLQQM